MERKYQTGDIAYISFDNNSIEEVKIIAKVNEGRDYLIKRDNGNYEYWKVEFLFETIEQINEQFCDDNTTR